MQENEEMTGFVLPEPNSQWVRDPSNHHQGTSSQVWRMLPTWEQVFASLIKPPDQQFKGQSQTATAQACQTRPLGLCTLSPPRDTKNVTGEILWLFSGLTEVMIYYHCMILLQMEVILTPPIPGLKDTGWWNTQLLHKQLKTTEWGCSC